MNVRHLLPSVSRRLLSMGSLLLAAGLQQPVHASGVDLSKFRRIEPQYIAALGDPGATSGNGAQSWRLWSQDPGPRGCKLDQYDKLKAAGGVAQFMDESSGVLLEEIGGRDALPLQHCIRQILRKFVLVNECASGGVNIYHWHNGVPFAKRRQTQPCPDGLRHL